MGWQQQLPKNIPHFSWYKHHHLLQPSEANRSFKACLKKVIQTGSASYKISASHDGVLFLYREKT
jgi:hypothetical protein